MKTFHSPVRKALASLVFASTLAWSQGSLSPEESAVFGFEGPGWSGLRFVEAPLKEGAKAGLWTDHPQNKSVSSAKIPHDWSKANELRFWMHAKKNTGEKIMLVLDSRKDPKVFSYYSYALVVDWEGWKEVVIPFKKFSASRNPAGWTQIDSLSFRVDGWDLKPHPESELVLDAMRLASAAEAPVQAGLVPGKGPMKADPKRIAEIAAMLPKDPAPVLLVPAKNRAAWASLNPETAKQWVAAAEAQAKNGISPWNDDLYLAYTRQGKRSGDAMMGSRAAHLKTLVMGECVERKGRFLPAIKAAVESLASDRSWTLPAHDGKLNVYEGRTMEVDLSAASRALIFSGTLRLLEDDLDADTKKLLREELERRIFEPYRKLFTAGEKHGGFWWMQGDNNWNAVCHAGVVLSALAVIESREDRALFVNGAEQGVPWFLHGMPEDGYCTEGIGYWGYGFGNFVLLSMGLREATGGKIDWFRNEKVQKIGRFGRRMELMEGVYPAFADCGPTARPSEWIVYLMDRLYDPGKLDGWKAKPLPGSSPDPQSMCMTYLPGSDFHGARPIPELAVKGGDGIRDFYDVAGILNARPLDPSAPDAFAVSLKGGHNAEEHNHNDLGSFVVSTPDARPPILLDPGSEVYTARTFSTKRYDSKALSSWGHAVPLVGGLQQRPGRDAEAKVVETRLGESADLIAFDLTSAYDKAEGLVSLRRTFTYARKPSVSLTIVDEMKADRPLSLGNALLTYGSWKKTGPRTLLFWVDKEALEVAIEGGAADPRIEASIIDEDMGFRKKPTRVGISLSEDSAEAKLTLVIRRVAAPTDPRLENEGRGARLGVHHPDPSGATLVQAEDLASQTGGRVESVPKVGASGTAIKGWDDKGHRIDWKFNVAKAGTYCLQVKYCGESEVQRLFFVDGRPAGPGTNLFRFPATGGWSSDKDDFREVTLCSPRGAFRFPLSEGEHRISLEGLGGGMNVDWLRLVPATGRDSIAVNPVLEDADGDGVPDGWEFSPAPNGQTTKGKCAAEEGTPTVTLSDRDKSASLGLSQWIPVVPGREYRQSALLRGDGLNLYFKWYDKQRKLIGKEILKSFPGGGKDFAPAEWVQKAPEGAAFLQFWLYSSVGQTGETSIREAAVEELER